MERRSNCDEGLKYQDNLRKCEQTRTGLQIGGSCKPYNGNLL
jgi:hypothetical protein